MTGEETIAALFADWEVGRIDAIVSRFATDAIWHFSAGTKPPAVGHAAIASFLRGYAAIASGSKIQILRTAQSGDTLFFEASDRFQAGGRSVVVPYAGVVSFRDGLILDWRDYFDRVLVDGPGTLPGFAHSLLARPGQ
jgi:limonene-1,2-epoxide hydrolase